ncbi:MAG: hypothetical protein SF097_04820 [Acidobacteriota bacterium]|nr:hypothetical protein [Acidobacteriota bacterium]
MQTNESVKSQMIQQAVIEKLALLSMEKQQKVLAYADELAQPKTDGQNLWDMIQECTKDVPPEAWEELPTDGALNHDHYLYGAPKRYNPDGSLIER